MWEPPQRGDRERKRVSSFQDSTLTQTENDGLTPIAIDGRPFGTCSLIRSTSSKLRNFEKKCYMSDSSGQKAGASLKCPNQEEPEPIRALFSS